MVTNCKNIAIRKAKKIDMIKMTGILAPFIFSSVNPDSFIQMVPNTFGLYQINPITRVDNAATINAKKLISIMIWFIGLYFKYKNFN